MSIPDRIALIISLIAVAVAYWVAGTTFERIPHIEDEMAYVWQARLLIQEKLTIPSPPQPQSFLVPFVVDYHGQRFGKYPPGWPAMLAIGIAFGLRNWVNPLLAGLGVWLTYRLGKRIFGDTVGLLSASLTVISPFFLMNSSSLLSHPFGLVLSAAFSLAWLEAFLPPVHPRPWIPTLLAGLALGVLAMTRPLTAVGVALPFFFHGRYLLCKGDASVRQRVLVIGAITAGLAALVFAWQYAVTGDALLNPYSLWWPYDKLGFGPGIGPSKSGHNLSMAITNTEFSLWAGIHDLFGWGKYSWVFLPFGALAILPWRKQGRRFSLEGLLVGGVIVSLVLAYMLYWVGAALFGPRYYYEGLFSLTIFTAVGMALLAGWPIRPGQSWINYSGWRKARPLAMTALIALLAATSVLFYDPIRLGGMYGLYEIRRADLEPFLTPKAQELTPALVVVHVQRWMKYGALLDLESPTLDSPFIFVISQGERADEAVASYFPKRKVWHYYPDQPGVFYTAPK